MKHIRDSIRLLITTALIVGAAARITPSYMARQQVNSDGSACQPNIITQSVSLCPSRRPKGADDLTEIFKAYNESSIRSDAYSDTRNSLFSRCDEEFSDYASEPDAQRRIFPGRRKSFWSAGRGPRAAYENADEDGYENELEKRLNRIVELLSKVQEKETQTDYYSSRRVPYSSRRYRNFPPEVEDDSEELESSNGDLEYEELKKPILPTRPRKLCKHRKIYVGKPETEYVQTKRTPKLDWLMLKSKKCPKEYEIEEEPQRKCSRHMARYAMEQYDDEDEDAHDEKDILVIPDSTKSCRRRRYD